MDSHFAAVSCNPLKSLGAVVLLSDDANRLQVIEIIGAVVRAVVCVYKYIPGGRLRAAGFCKFNFLLRALSSPGRARAAGSSQPLRAR